MSLLPFSCSRVVEHLIAVVVRIPEALYHALFTYCFDIFCAIFNFANKLLS